MSADAAAAVTGVAFVDIDWRECNVRIEHAWIAPDRRHAPVLVFLHEGLGSLAMWKDFPQRLCDALGCRGLVYSRPGYGRSTPHPRDEAWNPDYLHQQAHELLPALLRALHIDTAIDKPWLFGHSDGASIALLYAARFAQHIGALVVLAPHIMVEDLSINSIEKARTAYLETDVPERLARYHDDPDAVFWRWNRIWLHLPFRQWSIEQEISAISCPLLAIQGLDDEYGTLAQVHGIARRVPQTQVLELAECRHSAHRDQGDAVIAAMHKFYRAQTMVDI